jgi:chitinase
MSGFKGTKYISFGGGNENGIISADNLKQWMSDLDQVVSQGFQGVIYDIEEVQGSASELNPVFADTFAATKKAGLKVGITVAHSAPLAADGADFVKAFVKDSNVDFISPQLYTTGKEASPQYDVTGACASTCTWDLYKGSIPKLVPSIVDESQYSDVQSHFQGLGMTTNGFFQWAQVQRRLLFV